MNRMEGVMTDTDDAPFGWKAIADGFQQQRDEAIAERDALQAKLDEAVGALEDIKDEERTDHINGGVCETDGARVAYNALASIKGDDT